MLRVCTRRVGIKRVPTGFKIFSVKHLYGFDSVTLNLHTHDLSARVITN